MLTTNLLNKGGFTFRIMLMMMMMMMMHFSEQRDPRQLPALKFTQLKHNKLNIKRQIKQYVIYDDQDFTAM